MADRTKIDWHNHTSDFSDGRLMLAEVAARGAALGIRIGVADHVLVDNPKLRSADQFLSYADALDAHGVLRGMEISLGEAADPDDRWIDRFQFVIAGMHTVPVGEHVVNAVHYLNYRAGVLPTLRLPPVEVSPEAYLDAVPRLVEDTLRRWPVTILGHFALVPALTERASPARVDQCLDAVGDLARSYGVAVEINGKSRVPDVDVVRRLAGRGATFSLGSDGHLPDQVGNLTYSLETWRASGISDDRLLAAPVDGSRAGVYSPRMGRPRRSDPARPATRSSGQ